jgi:hypothetical protein
MLKGILKTLFVFALVLSFTSVSESAVSQDSIVLPPPVKTGGLPLNEALAARASSRNFKPDGLTLPQLSQILWAAFGVNRDDGKRTIPTARDKKELQVYAVLASGVYVYDAEKNVLSRVLEGNFTQEFGKSPLTLLYAGPNNQVGAFHAGSAYQNVGLYCASEKLSNVVKGTGADKLKGKFALPEGFEVLVVQSIGLPE